MKALLFAVKLNVAGGWLRAKEISTRSGQG